MPSLTHAGDDALRPFREQLRDVRGPRFWRALEELADNAEFHRHLRDALPQWAEAAEMDRRGFVKLLGASLALAGLAGCSGPPQEEIVPWVRRPEGETSGLPSFYATALQCCGDAEGVLVETHMGRPSKIEGNPGHPASLGSTDALMQAAVLELWDPDRSQAPVHRGVPGSWDGFMAEAAQLSARFAHDGRGLHVLSGGIGSPTLAAQRKALLERFPGAVWHQYDPVSRDHAIAGARLAFGEPLVPRYHFDKAEVILSLEADFLATMPGRLRYAREFAQRRKPVDGQMNRLYVLEGTPSLTGAMADHRWALASRQIAASASELARQIGIGAAPGGGTDGIRDGRTSGIPGGEAPALDLHRMQVLADDLRRHRGNSLVLAGDSQPPRVHALAHLINQTLGNDGGTVDYAELNGPVEDQSKSLRELVAAMAAGAVDTLLILDGNPAYATPGDFAFAENLGKVAHSIHLGLYRDETAALCAWHLPATHALEGWSDARAWDGTASIVQPVIAPLYATRSMHELLAVLLGQTGQNGRDTVRATWRDHASGDFEAFWARSLREGVIAGTAAAGRNPHVDPGFLKNASAATFSSAPVTAPGLATPAAAPAAIPAATASAATASAPGTAAPGTASPGTASPGTASPGTASPGTAAPATSAADDAHLELLFRPDPSVWDGRYANNGWLQELPKPLTQLTWGNAALISPQLAAERGLANGDVAELRIAGRQVRAPVWIMPGQAARSVTVHLGYGRRHAGRIGEGLGFDAYALRSNRAPWTEIGLQLSATGKKVELATTQHHHTMQGRAPVRSGTLAQFAIDPRFAKEGSTGAPASLYRPRPKGEYAWGMTIDLNACIGCKACTIACQAENNIPVVGADQVRRGREMHWIRVDRYYEGSPQAPLTYHQPVPCMHCEHAPCELVCPVGATVHDSEGLNLQVYNRCVGTRFCSNNCPYKVRRFNFLQYTDIHAESLKAQRNPDVSVRNRGVMEKCTYCIQRIATAHIAAGRDDRRIADGEVLTACQAVCPTRAITFGNTADPDSAVSRAKASPLEYTLLEEQNTRPRTTYLAHLRNPNPDLGEDT